MTHAPPVGLLTVRQLRDVLAVSRAGPLCTGHPAWVIDTVAVGMELRSIASRTQRSRHAEREQLVECGAVLLNLRVAIRALHLVAAVRLRPDPLRPDIQARVEITDLSAASAADLALARQQSFSPSAPEQHDGRVGRPVGFALSQAARIEGGWLATIPDEPWRRADATAADRRLIVVVGTLDDGPMAALQAGQGAQRVALTASELGLRSCADPTPVSTPAGRRRLRALLGGALWPQVVLRLEFRDPHDR